jgi:hypothetical protein
MRSIRLYLPFILNMFLIIINCSRQKVGLKAERGIMDNRIQVLGKRAYAIPFVIALVIFCVLGTAIAPMMRMAPTEMPVAIVNLDNGAQLPTGDTLVAGDLVVEALQEAASEAAGDDGEAPMAWTELSSRAELDDALAGGEYYGAIVIPADFTQSRMTGQTALIATLSEGLSGLMAAQQQAAATAAQQASAAIATGAAASATTQVDPVAAQAAIAQQLQGVITDAVAAQTAADKPKIELVVNTVKSPIFANTMQTTIGTVLAQQGIEVEVTSIGEIASDANPLAGILGVQMMVMPLFIMSLAMSIVVVLIGRFSAGKTCAEKGKSAGMQVMFAAVASLVAATLSYGVVAWMGGIETPATAILFLWLASFCVMLACIGLCKLSLPLGLIVMLCVFALGMGTAVLPAEMLPAFWADWVAPWAPQVAIGEGLRNIILLNGGAFDVGCGLLVVWGCVGLAALLLAIAVPSRPHKAKTS